MANWSERTELLIGKEGIERLQKAKVLVVGLGGVGAIAAEMICRAGVGHMTLIDRDVVNASNINRQIIALQSTIGLQKAEVLADRLRDINPDVELEIVNEWLDENNMDLILDSKPFDYVVDAIDTISPKAFLIKGCVDRGLKVISAMGAGAKLNPQMIRIDDISKTNYCPLAKATRKRLAKMGVKRGVKCVYSTETSIKESVVAIDDEKYKKTTTGTISYMPSMVGLMLASEVIRDLIKN